MKTMVVTHIGGLTVIQKVGGLKQWKLICVVANVDNTAAAASIQITIRQGKQTIARSNSVAMALGAGQTSMCAAINLLNLYDGTPATGPVMNMACPDVWVTDDGEVFVEDLNSVCPLNAVVFTFEVIGEKR